MENRIDRILILPQNGTDFEEQFLDCLNQVAHYIEWTGSRIVQQAYFINALDNTTYLRYHEHIMKELSKTDSIPSTSIIAQPPATGHELSLELIMISQPSADLKIIYAVEQGVHYTLLSSPTLKEVYAGGITSVKPFDPFIEQVQHGYQIMEAILIREGMSFSDIARQWNYVEEILSIHDMGEEHMQNYQVLNDVRTKYYGKSEFVHGYPAATGIGMNSGGIVLEIYALRPYDAVEIIPIKNPKQVDAYHYSDKVLVGDALEPKQKKSTPKFERAKYVGISGSGTVYVSGTASIQNELTLGEDDVEFQSKVTMDNISNLIKADNLVHAGLKKKPDSTEYTFIRVYIKNKPDFELVKKLCVTHYGDITVHYLIADVCRDNLLLEIEGVVAIR